MTRSRNAIVSADYCTKTIPALPVDSSLPNPAVPIAFLHVAVIGLIGQIVFVALAPRDLAGDRSRAPGRSETLR